MLPVKRYFSKNIKGKTQDETFDISKIFIFSSEEAPMLKRKVTSLEVNQLKC